MSNIPSKEDHGKWTDRRVDTVFKDTQTWKLWDQGPPLPCHHPPPKTAPCLTEQRWGWGVRGSAVLLLLPACPARWGTPLDSKPRLCPQADCDLGRLLTLPGPGSHCGDTGGKVPAGEAGKGCAAGGEPPSGHLGCSLNCTEQEVNSGSGRQWERTPCRPPREAHPRDRGPRGPVGAGGQWTPQSHSCPECAAFPGGGGDPLLHSGCPI